MKKTSTPRRIDWPALLEAARRVRANAYAPYSRYKVGAAVLGGSGRIYAGCNVENSSFGLPICAAGRTRELHTLGELLPHAFGSHHF